MKNSISALVIILIIALCLPLVSSADSSGYIIDDAGIFTDEETAQLNAIAENYYSSCGIKFYYACTYDDFADFDKSPFFSYSDYIVLMENEQYWLILAGGKAEKYIGSEEKEYLWGLVSESENFFEGIKAFFGGCASIVGGEVSYKDDSQLFPESNPGRLYDGADLLTAGEESELLSKLNRVSAEYGTDFVIVTVNSIGGYTASVFTEEFFDRFDYGLGVDRNGVMLLLSMEDRDYRILSNGVVGDTIDDSVIDSIGNHITPSLSSGNYYKAFNMFIDDAEYQVNGAVNGFPFNFGGSIAISVIVGFIAAFITVHVMKGKLKSVKPDNEADSYLVEGSMNLSRANDMFLYASVSRAARASSSRSSSRSRSSGGSRHVGGGKF